MREIVSRRQRSSLGPLLVLIVLLAWPACSAAPALAPGTEAQRIVDVLGLTTGEGVADVGAGDGEWTEALARAVGPAGRVWATEVVEDELVKLRDRVADHHLDNVTVVAGDQEGTGLPESCCDAILLRMVYHHFQDPKAMRASLRRALRPGGRLAVIDIKPQKSWRHLEDVPERGGHGIAPDALVEEMKADGFEVLSRHDGWNDDKDRYCIVFRLAR